MQLLCPWCVQVHQHTFSTLDEGRQSRHKDKLFECWSCRAPPAVLLCSDTWGSLRLTMNRVAAVHQKFCGTQKYFHRERGTNRLTGRGHWSELPANGNIVSLGLSAPSSDSSFIVQFCFEQKVFQLVLLPLSYRRQELSLNAQTENKVCVQHQGDRGQCVCQNKAVKQQLCSTVLTG